jgi:hypothetical protein
MIVFSDAGAAASDLNPRRTGEVAGTAATATLNHGNSPHKAVL